MTIQTFERPELRATPWSAYHETPVAGPCPVTVYNKEPSWKQNQQYQKNKQNVSEMSILDVRRPLLHSESDRRVDDAPDTPESPVLSGGK